ncbi:MAG: right-handed parallel beta-helix repeat-containing protein [Bacteroidales bacterium]|nr:right-handed parallel beta-helix repeat-containing protein [Bacteroidales bacterium]
MKFKTISLFAISSLLACQATLAVTYYVSPHGKDSGNGLSRESPWQTIDRVNRQNLQPGDIVLFEAGETFQGNLSIGAKGETGNPITLSSFGNARAVIDAGKGTAIYITGDYVTVRNLNCVGAGRLDGNTGNGIEANSKGVIIDSVEVSGFQHSGVNVTGGSHSRITHVYAHDNGYAGIHGRSSDYMYVGYCIAENNPGDPTVTRNHSGSGILIGNSRGSLIEYCETFNNGWDMHNTATNGPVGIWTWNSDSIVIQYCISHDNKTQPGKNDGGGFDLDGGARNCIIQYCYSYNNAGCGYLLCDYGAKNPFVNNTVRYCISENDGRNNQFAGIFLWTARKENFGNCEIYNNVIYNSEGRNGLDMDRHGTNFNFRNNIFIIEGEGATVRGLRGDMEQGLFQGNCYWNPGGGFSIGSYRSLLEWASATGQEKVNGKIVGLNTDPMLIAPGKGEKLKDPGKLPGLFAYRLKEGSPLINAGLDLQSLFGISPGTKDLSGNIIPFETRYDIGAFEYQPRK